MLFQILASLYGAVIAAFCYKNNEELRYMLNNTPDWVYIVSFIGVLIGMYFTWPIGV
jgi:hypothetical protein